MRLRGKTAIVTGGARGIGFACAERFAREGARVAIADVDTDQGELAAARLKSDDADVRFVRCDVGVKKDVDALVESVGAAFGQIDILLNNAGVVGIAPFLDLPEELFDAVLRTSLKSVFLCSQAVARSMIARGNGGSIINLSSVNAVVAIPTHAAYCAAKGGVAQLTKAIALSLAPHAIRVNAIGPGTIATEMSQHTLQNEEAYRRMLSRTPLGRPGMPSEIAAVAVFLATDESSYMTGQTVYVDGGRLALNQTIPSV